MKQDIWVEVQQMVFPASGNSYLFNILTIISLYAEVNAKADTLRQVTKVWNICSKNTNWILKQDKRVEVQKF